MLTTPHLTRPSVHTRTDAASDRGPRNINADAVATHTDERTGKTAIVVADGVGDHLSAARAAKLTAKTAAEEAARTDAAEGLLRAQRELLDQFEQREADCVLVVAVLPSDPDPEAVTDIAWVGDCRAYRWNGGVLHQVTVDHTMAQFWRAHGVEPAPRLEHLVTTSARTAKPAEVGRTRVGAGPGRLLLSTDGVHKSLGLVELKTLLADGVPAGATAAALVEAARRNGSSDNATAVVADRAVGC